MDKQALINELKEVITRAKNEKQTAAWVCLDGLQRGLAALQEKVLPVVPNTAIIELIKRNRTLPAAELYDAIQKLANGPELMHCFYSTYTASGVSELKLYRARTADGAASLRGSAEKYPSHTNISPVFITTWDGVDFSTTET